MNSPAGFGALPAPRVLRCPSMSFDVLRCPSMSIDVPRRNPPARMSQRLPPPPSTASFIHRPSMARHGPSRASTALLAFVPVLDLVPVLVSVLGSSSSFAVIRWPSRSLDGLRGSDPSPGSNGAGERRPIRLRSWAWLHWGASSGMAAAVAIAGKGEEWGSHRAKLTVGRGAERAKRDS
jgi:hypothetical protein